MFPWLSEEAALDSFTPLQLDVFHALWDLYHTADTPLCPEARARNQSPSNKDPLRRFPIGTPVAKKFMYPSGSRIVRGQVFGYRSPWWRVRYVDADWEEMSATEVAKANKLAKETFPELGP